MRIGLLAMSGIRVCDAELLRIFIGESDKYHGRPLYEVIVKEARKRGMAGATVLRGILGFGAKSHLHTTHLLRLSQGLPLVLEVVDTQENIDRVMPEIDRMVGEGLITMEKVRVLRYGAADSAAT